MDQEPLLASLGGLAGVGIEAGQRLRFSGHLEENVEVIVHHDIGENFHPGKLRHPPHHATKGLLFRGFAEKNLINRSEHDVGANRTLLRIDSSTDRKAL
ncbi:MAG: hypothetical protein QNL33_07000 [Akkermansiaceae bacterium]